MVLSHEDKFERKHLMFLWFWKLTELLTVDFANLHVLLQFGVKNHEKTWKDRKNYNFCQKTGAFDLKRDEIYS